MQPAGDRPAGRRSPTTASAARTSPRATAWPGWPTGCSAAGGVLRRDQPGRRAAPTLTATPCRRATAVALDRHRRHAGSDRRRRGPAPGGPGPAARRSTATRWSAAVGDGPSLVEAVVDAPAGRVHRGRADAADRTPTRGCGPRSRPGARSPARPVLVLSQYVEVSYADDLLADRRAAAVGYLLKDRVADDRRVPRRAAAGGRRRHGARPGGGRPAAGPPPPRRPAAAS